MHLVEIIRRRLLVIQMKGEVIIGVLPIGITGGIMIDIELIDQGLEALANSIVITNKDLIAENQ